MEGEEALMSMLNQMVEIAQKEVDIFEFVSEDDLKEHGSARGMWASATRKNDPDKRLSLIWIDQALPTRDKVISIAHELGHVRNFVEDFRRDWKFWESLSWAKSVAVLRERTAWLYSVDYLKEVGFTDWQYFLDTVNYSVNTYFENKHQLQTKEDFFKELRQKIGLKSCGEEGSKNEPGSVQPTI